MCRGPSGRRVFPDTLGNDMNWRAIFSEILGDSRKCGPGIRLRRLHGPKYTGDNCRLEPAGEVFGH